MSFDHPLLPNTKRLNDRHYVIDKHDTIIWSSIPGWSPRKKASLFDNFAGDEVKLAYSRFHQALRSGEKDCISFHWRCDCVVYSRTMFMHISLYDKDQKTILYRSVLLEEKPHSEAHRHLGLPIVERAQSSPNVLKVCSYCMSVCVRDDEQEVWKPSDSYAKGNSANKQYTCMSHGICPSCYSDIQHILGKNDLNPLIEGFMVSGLEEVPMKITALAVDDDVLQRMIMKKLLTSIKVECTVAPSGEEAISLLKSTQFDVILLDCIMVGMDGFETAQCIRKMQILTPIIAVSGLSGQDGWSDRCLESGMDDYTGKPIDKDQMTALVTKWANKRHPHSIPSELMHGTSNKSASNAS
eukprot:TRINITY_DN7192_c0_g1_i1.p1 TRINITY_DN7192_c0_g1~~TRINITY_DN7192_c0_g1_i1.p1  ORF type:complete len:354 (-),score=26.31 TRINITY_DN7192_c0_g1_i1:59-1120(-)